MYNSSGGSVRLIPVDQKPATGHPLPERIAARIEILLASSPDPNRARRFLSRFRTECPAAFDRIASSPAALRYLITTFSYSNFLSDELIRQPEWLLQIATAGDMHRVLTPDEYRDRLADFLGQPTGAPPAVALARFRRRKILRIMLRDVLGIASLSDVTEELSSLSGAILEAAYQGIRAELTARHGIPLAPGPGGASHECGFAVIALGKLGGRELNYSSDIDLMFLYEANGETSGPAPITNKEFFKKLANQYTKLLSTYTAEGLCYRVDLRLRPDGKLGEVCISLDGAREYYATRARDWELQMLIKGRVPAGDRDLGKALLDAVEPKIYSTTLDFRAVESVSETRQRIGEKLAGKRINRAAVDVKLCPGGIRDIEFLVQCLQRLHGGRESWVRHGGTLHALFRLRDKGLLSASEYSRLASAYEFLRNLEHRLQFDEDRQTHTLPTDPEALDILARKIPAAPGVPAAAWEFVDARLKAHLAGVREIYRRVIHAQQPMYYSPLPASSGVAEPETTPEPVAPASNLTRFLDQRAPQLGAVVARARLQRGRLRFEHFLEKIFANPDWLARLDSDPALADCALDLFEHSQYFGEELIRTPELIAELCPTPRQTEPTPPLDPGELRRFFRREMVRVQSESIFRHKPIFDTLEQTSDLADAVISAAFRTALRQAQTSQQPISDGAGSGMLVIALGRLGMREFDLASDADLVFVIPDREASNVLFWTGVAERTIDVISSYTGDGFMFSVDTRLRPNGREGALVQNESAYKEYFASHAEAWEGIAYMKARCIAGEVERGTAFLHELQDVDWRRYGQSGRSRQELADMRARLEREQGARNPLKAGRGGYYDIDFALMYLRLKSAGIFFKVLNTPQRIDVIEKMGHLDREDADFLRDAAVFYRAIDHGMRIGSGHAEGKLPPSQGQMEILTELVRRWTPERLHAQRLNATLHQIRTRTREFFNRVFR
ncbi:MAG: glutamine-synthetase adenylyltransferase [Bryobacteraceae bacterium]